MDDFRRRLDRTQRRTRPSTDDESLALTADGSRGTSNLATVPRAGNISSDTRAGW